MHCIPPSDTFLLFPRPGCAPRALQQLLGQLLHLGLVLGRQQDRSSVAQAHAAAQHLGAEIGAAHLGKALHIATQQSIHALRTTLASLMNKAGVAPRTAQAAMRHSDIRLTMETFTDPKLLDVRGALGVLPALPLNSVPSDSEAVRLTGTDGRTLAPTLAPTSDNLVQARSSADKVAGESGPTDREGSVAVKSCRDKRKGRLSSADNRPDQSGRQDGY